MASLRRATHWVAVANCTRWPASQARIPIAIARCVLPVPGELGVGDLHRVPLALEVAGVPSLPVGRRLGVDANVSNVTICSIAPDGSDVTIDRVDISEQVKQAAAKRQRSRSQRRLDRSRRATNPERYEPSPRQAIHNERRGRAGLQPVHVGPPKGPGEASKAGVPKRAYRH